jgi:hypothetical protein
MMARRLLDQPSRSHLLLVACAILGLMFGPTPAPGLATPAQAAPGGGSPTTPCPEDTEGDETPAEAGDPAQATPEAVASRPAGRTTRPALTARLARARARSRPDAPAPETDLPVLLCRLTC